MLSLINHLLFLFAQDFFDKFFENLLQGNSKLLFIMSVVIAGLAILNKVFDLASKIKDALEGYGIVKKKLNINNNTSKESINPKSKIKLSKLKVVTNPANEYIQNLDNVEGLLEYIRDDSKKIIAVRGTAGIGKTKLVEYICKEKLIEEFEVQIYVDFESVNIRVTEKNTPTKDILEAAKAKMNAALGGVDRDDNYHSIAKHFQKPTIIFIDNYEQILENPELDLEICNTIIKPFSNNNHLIKFIITSREKIDWASNFKVERLSNISKEEARQYSIEKLLKKATAVLLFCKIHNQLARKDSNKIKPFNKEEFLIIVDLCNTVSNLPLGIHLIASSSLNIKIATIEDNLKYYLRQPLPNSFQEFGKRHTTLYNVFRWNFDSLTNDEKEFYKHISQFPNGFFISNIPEFLGFNSNDIENLVIKLYRKSLLREQEYDDISEKRYEIYILFKELLMAEDSNFENSLDKSFLNSIYERHLVMLQDINSKILGSNSKTVDFIDLKGRLRLDYENIEFFIDKCKNDNIDLAINLLVLLERLLNEVGPYIKLEFLYDDLIERVINDNDKARLLMSKARVLKSTENSRKESLDYVNQAIDILHDKKEITETLGEAYRIGTYLSGQTSKFELGKTILEKVNQFEEKEKVKLGNLNYAFIMLEQAKLHEREANITMAENCFKMALDLMSGYKLQQGKAYSQSALLYWRLGFSEKAREQLETAISNYEGIGEDRWILGFRTNLGLLYCDQDRLDLSEEETNKAYEALKHQGPYGWHQVNLLNKGRIISRYDRNETHFEKAKSIFKGCHEEFEKIGYGETMVLASVELAELYYKYGKYDKALEHTLTCISEAKKEELTRWMRYFRALCLLGLLNYKNDEIEESHNNLKEAQNLIDSFEKGKNQWLTYKVTRIRYNELNNLHNA